MTRKVRTIVVTVEVETDITLKEVRENMRMFLNDEFPTYICECCHAKVKQVTAVVVDATKGKVKK